MWKIRSDDKAREEYAIKQVLPPCQIKCPIGEPIQRTNVMISLLTPSLEKARDEIIQIGDYLYEKNPFFPVCGYICGLCERECNLKENGGSVKRRLLKRFLSDYYVPYLVDRKPIELKKDKGPVAVLGAGPAGLFCAYELSKLGYKVTVFERASKLGGSLRYIPRYRLPSDLLDVTLENLVRIYGIDIKLNQQIYGDIFERLEKEGFRAIFVATGTPLPRPLTLGTYPVEWQGIENVEYGINFLYKCSEGSLESYHFKGKRVIVIGGGNVAFDVARSAARLGGDVTVVCLETWDKSQRDGIPADEEEIEGAEQEGIRVVYSRGVRRIIGENGKFKKIECPRCISVFDEKGFNPKFDLKDVIELEGDFLLISIGQTIDRGFLSEGGLFDEKGRLAVDPLTLQSTLKRNVFIGGDVRKIGFMADAMAEGRQAAQSIDQYLRGVSIGKWNLIYEPSRAPLRQDLKSPPEKKWKPVYERMNFDLFEIGFTLEEAIREAKRCLACGPCVSCKACVACDLRSELPTVTVNEDLCSGCGLCASVCNYGSCTLRDVPVIYERRVIGVRKVSYTDPLLCKGCGMCISVCPADARKMTPAWLIRTEEVMAAKGLAIFACRFSWPSGMNGTGIEGVGLYSSVDCIGMIGPEDIIEALKKGHEGVLLLGCPPGDCHFQDGDTEAKKKIYILGQILETFGYKRQKVEIVHGFDPEGETIAKTVKGLRDKLSRLMT